MRRRTAMKKKLLSLFLVGSFVFSMPVYAEEQKTQFSFRDIPWYSTKTDAEKILTSDGATTAKAAWEDYILRMSGINFTNTLTGNSYVDGGGFTGRYKGINVAGYEASDTCACYIFTIDSNGNINKSVDDAQFYFGWYEFNSDDYVDSEGVYIDLSEKLSSLYGDGLSDAEDDYFSTTTWYDDANNQIRLLLGGKDRDKKYVTLGYIAAEADERLDEMQIALDSEAANAESIEREKNKNNLSGL